MRDDSWRECSATGKEGVNQVVRFIEGKEGICFDTKTFPEPASEMLQKNLGDILVRNNRGECYSVEVKTEEKAQTGNFFLESWSNKKFGMQTPGWMVTCKARFIAYVFLENRMLYMIPMEKLWRWIFIEKAYQRYEEKPQNKHNQRNETWGWCVPIEDVRKSVGFHQYFIASSSTVIEASMVADMAVAVE